MGLICASLGFVSRFQIFLVILYQSGKTQIWLLITSLVHFIIGLIAIMNTVGYVICNVTNPVCSQGNWSFSFLSSMKVWMNAEKKYCLQGYSEDLSSFSYLCWLNCIHFFVNLFVNNIASPPGFENPAAHFIMISGRNP